MRWSPITLARVRRRRIDQLREGVAPPRPCILRAAGELGRGAVAFESSSRWPSDRFVRLARRPAAAQTGRMNLDALWHDLECGGYREDLPLWRALVSEAGGPVLDVGAGTGRVTLDLAARGVAVVALDVEAALLEALAHRATGVSVETVAGDARQLAIGRRFSLVIVPMQML